MLTTAGGDITGHIPMVPTASAITLTDPFTGCRIPFRRTSFYDSIFVYSRNPDSAFYRVGFTNVGENQGIRPQSTLANGRYFPWWRPKNGVPQGSYKPVRLCNTKEKPDATVTSPFDPDSNSSVYADMRSVI